MKEVTLPSGSLLKITPAPFAVSKALYQSVLEEMKSLKLDPQSELDFELCKNLFCTGFSSKRIDTALTECMKRALYNNLKITDDTFEDETAREDYITVCLEVALLNIRPFTKNLFAELSRIGGMLGNSQELKS